VTVLGSNIRPLVEPNLELQLQTLKDHMGIDSLAETYHI